MNRSCNIALLGVLSTLLLAACSDASFGGVAAKSKTKGDETSETAKNDGLATTANVAADVPGPASLRVHYPVAQHKLEIVHESGGTESPAPLDKDTYELALGEIQAPLKLTPLLDGKPAKGPPYVVKPGETLDVYPHFVADQGKVLAYGEIASKIMGKSRLTRLYLPPSYDENTAKRYPVIYMHDGQAIFEQRLGFGVVDYATHQSFGTWALEKALDDGIASGAIPEVIIAGVDIKLTYTATLDLDKFMSELMAERVRDLTPTPDDAFVETTGTGQGEKYLRFIAEEFKTNIDKNFRTLPDRDHTFMMGSSLGGTISVWAGLHNGDVFGAIASLSTAVYWDKEVLVRQAANTKVGPKTSARIYVDTGENEPFIEGSPEKLADLMPSAAQQDRLVAGLTAAGYEKRKNLIAVVDPNGIHNGSSWSKRAPSVLAYLLGPGR